MADGDALFAVQRLLQIVQRLASGTLGIEGDARLRNGVIDRGAREHLTGVAGGVCGGHGEHLDRLDELADISSTVERRAATADVHRRRVAAGLDTGIPGGLADWDDRRHRRRRLRLADDLIQAEESVLGDLVHVRYRPVEAGKGNGRIVVTRKLTRNPRTVHSSLHTSHSGNYTTHSY